MSRFKIKFRLQGLELDIEGDRRDVGVISQAVGDQVAALIAPSAEIVNGQPTQAMKDITPAPAIERKMKRRRSLSAQTGASTPSTTLVVDFKHEPERFRNPTQEWTTAQKAMWLIHVVGQIAGKKQLTTGQIYETFNKHFRQSGALNRSNMNRDLGRAKSRVGDTPALVGEDTTKSPPEWYLLEEG